MIKEVLCVGLGVVAGYSIAYSYLEKKYADDLVQVEEDLKDYYAAKYDVVEEHPAVDPENVRQAAEALLTYMGEDVPAEEIDNLESQRKSVLDEPQEPETKVQAFPTPSSLLETVPSPVNYNSISTNPEPEPVVTTEEKEAAYQPLTISKDDFINNRTGLDQFSLSYFAGDDILADESDRVLDQEYRDANLGSEVVEVLKAGPEAMGGENAWYIRNDNTQSEIEIIWNAESYSEIVGHSSTTG